MMMFLFAAGYAGLLLPAIRSPGYCG